MPTIRELRTVLRASLGKEAELVWSFPEGSLANVLPRKCLGKGPGRTHMSACFRGAPMPRLLLPTDGRKLIAFSTDSEMHQTRETSLNL